MPEVRSTQSSSSVAARTRPMGPPTANLWRQRRPCRMRKCQKRPIYRAKEAYLYGSAHCHPLAPAVSLLYAEVSKETYLYGKRGLLITLPSSRASGVPAVCGSVKRDLFIWQKRPVAARTRPMGPPTAILWRQRNP